MNLSHAMTVAADGIDVKDEQLRAIALMLEPGKRGPGRRPRQPVSAADLERSTRWPQESVHALQASRRLLARTIDMLL